MVIPSFVPAGESAQLDARSRMVSGILQGRLSLMGSANDTARWGTCRLSDGRGSTEERERQPEIRDCFADVGSREDYAIDIAPTPAKQAVRMRANPRGAVFVCDMRIIRIGLLSTRRECSP
ncbi:MAG: hypothetical protein ABIO06_05325 [Pseudolysinimonas sp.]